MATFPQDPKPNYPLILEPEWKTGIVGFDGGGEQRRQKTLFPVYNVIVKYTALSHTDMQILYDFFYGEKSVQGH
jgi:hypothetical protein